MAPVATDFVKLLTEVQLLEDAQLEELSVIAPAYRDAAGLTSELVRRGWLTSYQLAHLNNGTHRELLLGPYVLLEELGRGGMGMVYKARHRRLERIVALKVISPAAMSNEAVHRLHREARAIARLKHPNIVLLYDAAEIDGKHFLALEYVDGIDLDRLLHQRGPFPIGLACEYIRQAALGLQHAHERGLVHRDVKPSNLVMTDNRLAGVLQADGAGLIKILDLGLARVYPIGATTLEGAKLSVDGYVIGTPDYLAPEQAVDSHTVDIRADIYSLGCTIYELLTGETPFAAVAGGTQKLLSHLQVEPPPVEIGRPDLPPGVVAIVRKMMAKKREERFPTPGQVADALIPFAKLRAAAWETDNGSPAGRAGGVTNVIRIQHPSPSGSLGLYVDLPMELGSHEGKVHCVAISPNGRLVLSGGQDQAVYLWDVLSLKKVRLLHGHTDVVRCVAFAPDGRTAVSGGSDCALFLWDVETGHQLARFKGQTTEAATAAFSPDGKFVLTGGKDQGLYLWDVATRRYLRQLGGVVRGRHFDAVTSVAFAPDGARAVSVSLDKTMRLWNIQTGRELRCFEGHIDQVNCVAYSPDGLHLTSAGRASIVRLWGVVSGEEIRWFEGHTGSVHGVAFSPGGRQILSGGDTTIGLWEAATGQMLYSSKADTDEVLCVAMTADGSHLLAAGGNGVVRLWSKAL
jgi:serine/threonine protein kinase